LPESRTQRTQADASRGRAAAHEPGWPVAIGLVVTIVGSIGFVVAFARDAGAGWIGGCLGAALLGLGLAFSYWGRDLVGDEVAAAPYPLPPSQTGGGAGLAADLEQDLDAITRRGFLSNLLVAGFAVFGLSQVVLVATFGPRPRDTLTSTQWRAGSRLATIDGRLVTPETLGENGLLVVFPEGHPDAADSQVTLLRPPADRYRPLPGREEWSPEGYVAYSRVCTHAGCPVAQYEDEAQVLVCPCHQSTFDVLDGARPLSGPAGRALPQLPLMIDAGGYLAARGDFVEPVGPGFWNL
jgi:ubiquinol-cytochrome c reductase iron-sulfur subunit